MARYFKYKSPEEMVADAASLGLELSLSNDFSVLFQPISIGPHTAGNRLAIQPMEGCDGTLDGFPDELTYRRYRRFGAGGAKLIWAEATAIADSARMNPRQLWLNDKTASAIEDMLASAKTAHHEACGTDADLVIGLQLTHSGRFSFQKPLLATHDLILDPLTVDKSTGKTIDDSYPLLTDDDLKRIEDQYLVAAKLSAKIGVQFIDLKQCHRYLLSELLAAKNRPGDYGGSLENRTRLIRNIIGRVKSELPDLTIATRMNAYDGIPYQKRSEDDIGEPCPHQLPLQTAFGTNPNNHLEEDIAEPVQLATWLKDWGVGLINISCGNPYANPHVVRPAEFAPTDGYHSPEHPLVGVLRHFRITKKIQSAVGDLPVIGSAYSWLQDYAMHAAAANIASGAVSMIGMGRATLSHPDFVKTLAESGSMNRKKICRTFSYCTNLMRSKDHPLGQYPTGCPPFDKEVYDPLWKEAKEKLKQPE
jgi:2,4-dienoyl-CoA reductase-like NADH-dependent reductase (Old Yellow Enzyme family)